MKKYLFIAVTVVSVVLPSFLFPHAYAAQVSDSELEKLLALSGLNKQMDQLPGTVRAGIMQARQRGMNVPDAEFTEMINIIANSFQPANLMTVIRTELKTNLSSAEVTSLLSWYQSEPGKKVTSAEEAASTPDAYNQMLQQAKTLLADEKKLVMAKRMEKALSSIDMAIKTQESTGIAVYTALLTAAEPSKPVNIEPFKAQMTAQLPQVRSRLEQLILVSLLYSYKDMDPDTIEKYLVFLEKPTTQKFTASVTEGLNKAITKSTDTMAQDLANLFTKARKTKETEK